MLTEKDFITPNWPAPASIHAYSTTRIKGYSQPPFEHFNLSFKPQESATIVKQNRALLKQVLNLPSEPIWLKQPHSNLVIDANSPTTFDADGSYSRLSQNQSVSPVCTIMTADCLPILLCNKAGTEIAALHAGWRSLASGIIETGIKKFTASPNEILAWLGPAITQTYFEVGKDVRNAFMAHNPNADQAFKPSKENKWFADLYQLARQRLTELGINQIYGGNYCTYADKTRFYSYRRDPQTGRQASLIWIE